MAHALSSCLRPTCKASASSLGKHAHRSPAILFLHIVCRLTDWNGILQGRGDGELLLRCKYWSFETIYSKPRQANLVCFLLPNPVGVRLELMFSCSPEVYLHLSAKKCAVCKTADHCVPHCLFLASHLPDWNFVIVDSGHPGHTSTSVLALSCT